jgi:hypothetical protein
MFLDDDYFFHIADNDNTRAASSSYSSLVQAIAKLKYQIYLIFYFPSDVFTLSSATPADGLVCN